MSHIRSKKETGQKFGECGLKESHCRNLIKQGASISESLKLKTKRLWLRPKQKQNAKTKKKIEECQFPCENTALAKLKNITGERAMCAGFNKRGSGRDAAYGRQWLGGEAAELALALGWLLSRERVIDPVMCPRCVQYGTSRRSRRLSRFNPPSPRLLPKPHLSSQYSQLMG